MLKRVIGFGSACFIGIKNGQLLHRPKDSDSESIIPLEDVGFVVIEHPAVTITSQAIQRLVANGTAVIFCDSSHHPCAMTQAFDGHSTHAETLRSQVAASAPLTKRLWQQIVSSKIRNQAALLARYNRVGSVALQRLASEVRSGDVDNREAVAARFYWRRLFDRVGFKRSREGDVPNNLLNYGYAMLRAACARALVSSGLHCAIGLHHQNRYNAFCLADDVMEPYRPFVDRLVCASLAVDVGGILDRAAKLRLLGVLSADVDFGDKTRPLMNGLSLTTASLVRCLAGESQELVLPSMP